MTEKRYSRFKSEITGLFCIADENLKETFCGMDNEYNCVRIVNILNQKEERIKELEKEKEFWKHNCISESNRNSILICELGFAQEQGYKWSDAFEKYENYVKENSEWNKRYLSEKGNGGDVE